MAEDADVVITEVGGTVGDIESLPFLEAIRQFRHDVGRENVFSCHVSLVPFIGPSGELKTKPTQHSVRELRSIGIQPDAIVCRTDRPHHRRAEAQDHPAVRRRRRGDRLHPRRRLDLRDPADPARRGPRRLPGPPPAPRTGPGSSTCRSGRRSSSASATRTGSCGSRSSASTSTCPTPTSRSPRRSPTPGSTTTSTSRSTGSRPTSSRAARPRPCSTAWTASWSRAGSAVRGVEGKIDAIRYAREEQVPFLGICLGLQCAVIEFARNVADLEGANSTEFEPDTAHPVIDLMPDQRGVADMGGTMRLGLYPCRMPPGTRADGGLRRRARLRAPPPPVRGQQPLPPPPGGRRPGLLRHLAGRAAGRDRRAGRPPLVRRHPVPPGVPLPPDPPPPAVPRLRRGGGRAGRPARGQPDPAGQPRRDPGPGAGPERPKRPARPRPARPGSDREEHPETEVDLRPPATPAREPIHIPGPANGAGSGGTVDLGGPYPPGGDGGA